MNLFTQKSYKSFLKKIIEKNKGEKAFQAKLANAASCQRSYLSQVLHREVNLTPDQAYGIGEFLGFSEDEVEYFVLLVQFERAGSPSFRKFIKKRMKHLSEKNSNLSLEIERKSSTSKLAECSEQYYSHWSYMAVHMATFLKSMKTTEDFSRQLGLKEENVRRILKELERFGLIKFKGSKWVPLGRDLNLKDNDKSIRNHHLNWRLRALDHLSSYDSKNDLHYSAVFAISQDDSEKIKSQISQLIVEARNRALDSPPEKCVNFNIDFYGL